MLVKHFITYDDIGLILGKNLEVPKLYGYSRYA